MALSDDDVREILRIIDESDLAELRIETEGFSLHVVRGAAAPRPSAPTSEDAAVVAAPDRSSASLGKPSETDGFVIKAPMLGTFYRAEAPGKLPFVEVGSRVEPDTIVCIIEVMKMMNSVPAGISGSIAEVVPDNAQLVEYGQPLFRVEPG
jgi:acetyl-CoA carboxylase biotin carboxyl carrier protein